MGQRRVRRLQRARHYRVGIAVGACVALLVGAITVSTVTIGHDEASADTWVAAAAKTKTRTSGKATARRVVVRSHTSVKTAVTKAKVNEYPPPPANSGAGRRIVYCNSCQRVWLIESDGWIYVSYQVSGHRNYPRPGTYKVIRRTNPGYSHTLRLPYFVGFTYGNTTDVGFHGIPLRPNGTPIESDSQLGQFLSHGCVRENQYTAKVMWDWATMGTPVVVTA
ncbi:MAG: L,D-transpeptidase [Acidimicrobiia bacterium]